MSSADASTSTAIELALIRQRLDQILALFQQQGVEIDACRKRLDDHSKKWVAAEASAETTDRISFAQSQPVNTSPASRRVLIVGTTAAATGGVTLGALLDKLLALLF